MHRIGEIRSILPPKVNVMALTATATKTLRLSASRVIGLRDPFILAIFPSKHNVCYAIGCLSNIEDTFTPLIKRLATERTHMPRTLIYCRKFEDCADIYILFRSALGKEFTNPPGAPDLPQFRMVDMFTSITDKEVKEVIIDKFTSASQLRIVVATITFGLGIDCPDVRQVVHMGAPDDNNHMYRRWGEQGGMVFQP